MTTLFRKFILGALIAALALAALPLTSVFAAGALDPVTPPTPGTPRDPAIATARLELAFARQQIRIARIGEAVVNYDLMTKNVQILLDKAKANGKDVSAVQTAFDAYKAAFAKAKPFYDQAKAIATAHGGFDANGKVTDLEKAKATVKSLADIFRQYADTLDGTLRTLREAIQAFRLANPRPVPTPVKP
jgi:hypothetical protein